MDYEAHFDSHYCSTRVVSTDIVPRRCYDPFVPNDPRTQTWEAIIMVAIAIIGGILFSLFVVPLFSYAGEYGTVEVATYEFESTGDQFAVVGRAKLTNSFAGTTHKQELSLECFTPDQSYVQADVSEATASVRSKIRHFTFTHTVLLVDPRPPVGLIRCVLLTSFTTDPIHRHEGQVENAYIVKIR